MKEKVSERTNAVSNRIESTYETHRDQLRDAFGERAADLYVSAVPKAYGVVLGSLLVASNAYAQSGGLCQGNNFFSQAFGFLLMAGGTFLVGAIVASQLLGGGGQSLALSSDKQQKFKSMQMGGITGGLYAFAGLALLSIMIGWVAFPVDMSCFQGFNI